MDIRKKLLELIVKASHECDDFYDLWDMRQVADGIADYLIANGVTVQEEAKLYWKPVKPGEWILTCSACDSHLVCKENANFCPECGAKFVYPKAVMPQPPKGE
jgi:rubrerythrin